MGSKKRKIFVNQKQVARVLKMRMKRAKMLKQIQAQLALIAVTALAVDLELGTTDSGTTPFINTAYDDCGFTDGFESCRKQLYYNYGMPEGIKRL